MEPVFSNVLNACLNGRRHPFCGDPFAGDNEPDRPGGSPNPLGSAADALEDELNPDGDSITFT